MLLCRHLRVLLRDAKRSEFLFHEHNKIISDFSRQRVTEKTIEVWWTLADPIVLLDLSQGNS